MMQSHMLVNDRIKEKAHESYQALAPVIERFSQAYTVEPADYYATRYGFINLVRDVHDLPKKLHNCSAVVVIGIGGSSLGAQAIVNALKTTPSTVPVYFADTIDTLYTRKIIDTVKTLRANNQRVCCVVISKSGSTLETCVNASLLVPLVEPRDVCIITDASSKIYEQAQQAGYTVYTVPELVGGRFSVFSSVGLVPLSLAGYNVVDLCTGAQAAVKDFFAKKENDSIHVACELYALYTHGYTVYDTFVFEPRLTYLGQWFRQLVGESLCKRYSVSGKLVERGIIPTVSVGTQDLHSVVQLYLGGPRTVMTQFLCSHERSDLIVGDSLFSRACTVPEHAILSDIKRAIFDGVCAAYAQENRPYVSYTFDSLTPYNLGYWMQQKMIEVVLLAQLMQVNPFDQPQVELYKKEVRKLLGKNNGN